MRRPVQRHQVTALSRVRIKEGLLRSFKIAGARGYVKQKLAGAHDWIAGTHPRVCWPAVRLLRYVPQQLDESAALEDLTIGAGHTNKWHECL
jgi:hypothetical protein